MEISTLENQLGTVQREAALSLEKVQDLEIRIQNVGNESIKRQTDHIQKLKDVSDAV